jgi:Flp pilus assembly protein protease CpaA
MIPNSFYLLLYSNIVLIYCMYRDIKYRSISNKLLIGFLLIGGFLTFTVDLGIYNSIFIFILSKVSFIFFVFLLSFILFCLKVIGGADGKLLILLIFSIPTHILNFEMIYFFFFIFLSLYLTLILVSSLFNIVLSKNIFYIMINSLQESITLSNRIFILLFCKFLDFSQINDYANAKFSLKSLNLFYNVKKEKFQILTQFRPPLVILIFITYNFVLVNYFF